MNIYTKSTFIWNGVRYTLDKSTSTWYDYSGSVDLCCGASSEEKSAFATQQNITSTITQQLAAVFGDSSSIFNDLTSTLRPISAAGPNQEGYSPGAKSALNSAAITETGQAYNNAKQAVGDRIAAQGGGNMALPSGAAIGPQLSLAESAANQTSGELNQINQASLNQGRQNWIFATQGLAGAPNVFNPSVGMSNSLVSAGEGEAKTAADISAQNNSWVNAAIGAAGQVAGAAAGAELGKSKDDSNG